MKIQTKKLKVAVGLSGGVDSSVSAYLLQKQGYQVTGVFMQCWDARADGCKSDEDRAFAVETAAKLSIKFKVLDFRKQYKDKVMRYFYDEYRAGRTPNPDVMCNKEIKFGLFFDWAMQNSFDFVATGHYARIKKSTKTFQLFKGKDARKDQSYFLYVLDQKQLDRILFPVGDMTKQDLRALASKVGLPTAKRAESMGICFIGEVDIKDFLKKQIKSKTGKVCDISGNIIGEHEGIWFYTIGQRHGFKLTKYFGEPMYVVSKDVDKNVLVVGSEKDAFSKEFFVADAHWIGANPLEKINKLVCTVRIRHLGVLHKASIITENGFIKITLAKPIFAVAPGQSVVFYKKDAVLGGGIIV